MEGECPGAPPFCFSWMGDVTTDREAHGSRDEETGGVPARRVRTTRVRTRCNGERSPDEEVGAQFRAALPQIVRAQVKRAKEGSLLHTRWLWSVAKEAPDSNGNGRAKASLAALLIEQLKSEL